MKFFNHGILIFPFLLVALFAFDSCQKESIPIEITKFQITDFHDIDFLTDNTKSPELISNFDKLPFWLQDSLLTIHFELSDEGTLWWGETILYSDSSKIPAGVEISLTIKNSQGEVSNSYDLLISVSDVDAPQILSRLLTLDPAGCCPLTAQLDITLDRKCRISTTVSGQDNNDFHHNFPDYASDHSLPILGLYPDAKNELMVVVSDSIGNTTTSLFTIQTEPLPELYPEIEVLISEPTKMEDGFVLMHLLYVKDFDDPVNFISMVDAYGKVRWLYKGIYKHVFRRIENGNWLIGSNQRVTEYDLYGNPTEKWYKVPGLHHDVIEIPNGNFLALSEQEDHAEDIILEIDRETGMIENTWDMKNFLDIERTSNPTGRPIDWLHLNAIIFDPIDNAFIISGRNQSLVAKMDYPSGNLIWLLGNHENWSDIYFPYLLNPIGENFEWQWAQHAPMLSFTSNYRILMFDNGVNRSWDTPMSLTESYSRGVEYEIDENSRQITQLWEYGKSRGSELFCEYICDADYLRTTNNRLICFGGQVRNTDGTIIPLVDPDTKQPNLFKNEIRIVEVTQPGDVVFEIRIRDKTTTYSGYRSYRAQKLTMYPK